MDLGLKGKKALVTAAGRGLGMSIARCLAREGATLLVTSRKEFGAPDIVAHNLGSNLEVTDPFCKMEDWKRVIRLNLEIPIELNRGLVPLMQLGMIHDKPLDVPDASFMGPF